MPERHAAAAEPVHQGTGLTPTQFEQARQRADIRRQRWETRQREIAEMQRYDAATAATERAIAAAPQQIDLATFFQTHPELYAAKGRPVADGQLVHLRPGTQRWSLHVGNGYAAVEGRDFVQAGSDTKPDKPPGLRAVADLAESITAVRDRKGRPAPWASPSKQWSRGWRGPRHLSLAGVAAPIITAWAENQGLDYRRSRSAGDRHPRPVVGGRVDIDGFHVGRDPGEAAPGDKVRHDGAVYTVISAETGPYKLNGNTYYKLYLTLDRDGHQSTIGEPRRIDIQFAADPDAPESRYDPGMGMYLDRPGIPVDRQHPDFVTLRAEDLVPPGTRVLTRPLEDVSGRHDPRSTVGAATDHIMRYGGTIFQVFLMDDQTYDGIVPSAFNPDQPNATVHFELNPSAEDIAAAREAWGLDHRDQQ